MLGKYKKKIRNYLGVSPNEVWKEYGKELTKKMEEGIVKDKLVLLVGASGTGKTSVARELHKRGYNIIHSYTTREPREPNEWGHTFINKAIGHEIKMNKNMIAIKNLYDYEYWATKDQYQGKGTSIYIVDPEGAEQVKENVKDAKVITVVLMADSDAVRYRMKKQARHPIDAEYRIEKDKELFRIIKCDYVVNANQSIEVVTGAIQEIIEREMQNDRK